MLSISSEHKKTIKSHNNHESSEITRIVLISVNSIAIMVREVLGMLLKQPNSTQFMVDIFVN